MSKASEVLSRARELISTLDHWTQGESARTMTGRYTDAESDLACSWCTLGAVFKVTDGDSELYNKAAEYLAAVAHKQGYKPNGGYYTGVINYNDKAGRRHKEILELFDQATAYARSLE